MIHITEVTTKAQLRQFVNFPIDLYRDVPQYIPGTYSDDLADWDREKNPAFSYCEARCRLASRDDGTLVAASVPSSAASPTTSGVPTACVSRRWTSSTTGRYPPPCSRRWRTGPGQLGCTEIHGPLGFTDMDREGMLVEGFDRTSCFFTYYNHPYYIDHLTALGYGKDVDWTENLISVPTDQRVIQRWEKIAAYVLKRQRLHIHQVRSRLEYPPLIRKVFELVNVAYAPLYGTVELSDDQIRKYAGKFAPLVKPELTCFVMDENDDLVAFGVAAPSIAAALKKHDGRLFPTGWADVLKAFHRNDTIDLLLIAVRPDLQKKGVNAVIISKVMHGCFKIGVKQAETGPMLETNEKVQTQWQDFPLEQHKRRRCFVKVLTPAPQESAAAATAPAGAAE